MPETLDYHFLVLAPGLTGPWFTQAARQFWLRFQPIVTDDWELISRTPTDSRVAVTILARPDSADAFPAEKAALGGRVTLDVVVAGDLTTMEATLDERARLGLPFGEPEAQS
jgi:hypothetical protein